VGNAFVGNTEVVAAATFFFTTDGKSFVPTFNCSIRRANVEHPAYLSIYVFKHHSSSIGHDFIDGVLNMGGSNEGEGSGTGNDVVS
jgi:hypothetical protein